MHLDSHSRCQAQTSPHTCGPCPHTQFAAVACSAVKVGDRESGGGPQKARLTPAPSVGDVIQSRKPFIIWVLDWPRGSYSSSWAERIGGEGNVSTINSRGMESREKEL